MMNKVVQGKGVMLGGNANNGVNAGPVAVNSNNAPSNSNANHGSHLSMGIIIFLNSLVNLASWRKSKIERKLWYLSGRRF